MSYPFDYAWHDNDEVEEIVLIGRWKTWRNRELLDSDWTQLPDAPTDKIAWAEYRQALRDLDFSKPKMILLPIKPSEAKTK